MFFIISFVSCNSKYLCLKYIKFWLFNIYEGFLTAGVFHLCYAFMLYISHIVTEENN